MHGSWQSRGNFAGAEKLPRARSCGAKSTGMDGAQSYLAYSLTELRRLDEAIEQGRLAISIDPGSGYAHFTLARTLFDCARIREAINSSH